MPTTISIEVPDEILKHYKTAGVNRAMFEDIIAEEYRQGNISIREGAKVLGITYEGFMEWLGKRKISWINVPKEERDKSYAQFKEKMKEYGK